MNQQALTHMNRRAFLRRALRNMAALSLSLGAAGAGGYGYSTYFEPNWLAVEQVTIRLPHLPAGLAGLRMAQISDLHVGPYAGAEEVEHWAASTQAQGCDLIVITGDFISRARGRHLTASADELAPLATLRAPLGVYAVLGNHDHWTDPGSVVRKLQTLSIQLLQNESALIKTPGGAFWLLGLDDVWTRNHNLSRTLRNVERSAFKILAVHEPDFADQAAHNGIDLQLSGHSHGGQVRLPLLGAPLLPYLGQKYPIGLQPVGDMQVYTTRGLGVITPPVRFNCRPEVTVLTLQQA